MDRFSFFVIVETYKYYISSLVKKQSEIWDHSCEEGYKNVKAKLCLDSLKDI